MYNIQQYFSNHLEANEEKFFNKYSKTSFSGIVPPVMLKESDRRKH